MVIVPAFGGVGTQYPCGHACGCRARRTERCRARRWGAMKECDEEALDKPIARTGGRRLRCFPAGAPGPLQAVLVEGSLHRFGGYFQSSRQSSPCSLRAQGSIIYRSTKWFDAQFDTLYSWTSLGSINATRFLRGIFHRAFAMRLTAAIPPGPPPTTTTSYLAGGGTDGGAGISSRAVDDTSKATKTRIRK